MKDHLLWNRKMVKLFFFQIYPFYGRLNMFSLPIYWIVTCPWAWNWVHKIYATISITLKEWLFYYIFSTIWHELKLGYIISSVCGVWCIVTPTTSGAGSIYPSWPSWLLMGLVLCFVYCCLSFCPCSFWPLCCLFCFNLPILISTLISSNSFYSNVQTKWHPEAHTTIQHQHTITITA